MGKKLHKKIEAWKKSLLDFGKRNKLVNFVETKRSNIGITSPDFNKLFERVAVDEHVVVFPYPKITYEHVDDELKQNIEVVNGDVDTSSPSVTELQKTLKALRYKANTCIEEQGVNTLYLAFGLLNWREKENSAVTLKSPMVLVPVKLTIESLTSPYKLSPYDDDIVVNPTLAHKLDNDFGITLPDFDVSKTELPQFFDKCDALFKNKGWTIDRCVHLTNLSFLKINMYKDLERNEERLSANPIVAAIAGESVPNHIPDEINDFDHDKNERPIDIFQVVDADSSQQDAIVLSKRGVSFVLQGPPGTGKSQTITNIISEALADGKKVLFVSEKRAALQVVYNRLSNVGLSDYCLALHSHKANKKEILNDLSNSLTCDRKRIREEVLSELDLLERKRDKLNQYQQQLHTPCSGLNTTIFNINGKLAKLKNVPDVIFEIPKASEVNTKKLNDKKYLLQELAKTIGAKSEDYNKNVWRGASVQFLSNELRHNIDANLTALVNILIELDDVLTTFEKRNSISMNHSLDAAQLLTDVLKVVQNSPLIPQRWVLSDDLSKLFDESKLYEEKAQTISSCRNQLLDKYSEKIFLLNGQEYLDKLKGHSSRISELFRHDEIENLIGGIEHTRTELGHCQESFIMVFGDAHEIAGALGVEKPNTLCSLHDFTQLLECLVSVSTIKPTSLWFNKEKIEEIRHFLNNCQNKHEYLTSNMELILEDYKQEILDKSILSIFLKYHEQSRALLEKVNKDCIPDILDHIDNVGRTLSLTKDRIQTVCDEVNQVASTIGLETATTLESVIRYISVFSTIIELENVTPTSEWFDRKKYLGIMQSIDETQKLHQDYYEAVQSVSDKFDVEVLGIDCYPLLQKFRSEYKSIFRLFKSAYRSDLKTLKQFSKNGELSYKEAINLLEQLKCVADLKAIISNKENDFRCYYGSYYKGTSTNWDTLKQGLTLFDTAYSYPELMSGKVMRLLVDSSLPFSDIKKAIAVCLENDLESSINELSITLTKPISTQEQYSDILQLCDKAYYQTLEYDNSYKSAIDITSSHLNREKTIDSNELLYLFKHLKEIEKAQSEIESSKNEYLQCFGNYYIGTKTNWTLICECLSQYADLCAKIPSFPKKLETMLLEETLPVDKLSKYLSDFHNENIDSVLESFNDILTYRATDNTSFDKLKIECDKALTAAKEFVDTFEVIKSSCRGICSFNYSIDDLHVLIKYQKEDEWLKGQYQSASGLFSTYYKGEETNWDNLNAALSFAKEFKSAISDFRVDIYDDPIDLAKDLKSSIKVVKFPKSFIVKICENPEMKNVCSQCYSRLVELLNKHTEPLEWFNTLFSKPKNHRDDNLKDFAHHLGVCKDNKQQLEEWVDYCSCRKKCVQAGLNSYIKQLESNPINPDFIVDAYMKRFYRLWMDEVLPQFPAVRSFRSRDQQQTIDDFCKLDKEQFLIAQARVRERITSRIPDFNAITSSRDEIGVLKRELNKQRRIMPLRKLFKEIPNLLTTLRPCFMMSPLSVSVFLEAQSYDFDMIIFDEASQVHTEDAMGAIMRGKQIIIVGDTKQLPPTNFFSTSLNEDDFDVDEEDQKDNDAGAFESILDESVTILPERSLRWHYRSRDEHLIAFSNIKIYHNSLITFPSSIEKAADLGVEYVYVENGIYDRSGRRNNVMEAQIVAKLVFDHFRKHPKRSLGVVTFSEAQQNAVDAAIRQLRLKDNSLENFFNEDNEEPFFIKNLENVQGDERDTIIFSIGYAKDNRGVMYMNFGPLSKSGGFRRLNVAITRAKYNVKLVGSIVPTDIDIEKTSSEGVKLLRSYIEYAQQGIAALEKELTYDLSVKFDSPFEEAVYDFLASKGYDIVTQVGCSGYRIDMAVKHPTQKGRFAIGIECDGATYHSSRTVRERDRLRQSVLEDMGWTIYRVWSTDWIKNQKSEEKKLVDAIEYALSQEKNLSVDDGDTSISSDIPNIEIEESLVTNENEVQDTDFGFETYCKTNIEPYLQCNVPEKYIITNVIKEEQPIHFEELCRRVAPIWGNQRASSTIRRNVRTCIRFELRGSVSVTDDFLTLTDFDELKVRIPSSDGEIRPIDYICDSELMLAMQTIVSHSFGISSEALITETARVFGFKRTGTNIMNRLRNVYLKSLKEGILDEIEGKVKNVETLK